MRHRTELVLDRAELRTLRELHYQAGFTVHWLTNKYLAAHELEHPHNVEVLNNWTDLLLRVDRILKRLEAKLPQPAAKVVEARDFAQRARIAKSIACKVRDDEEGE